jgi:hypothetical protein
VKVTPWYDFSNSDVSTVEISNYGDKTILPEVYITKITDGDISIINLSNNQPVFEFVSLLDNEELYVNGENEIIETNLSDVWRFDNFSDNYLELPYGKNILQIKGKCKIKFQYRYKFII